MADQEEYKKFLARFTFRQEMRGFVGIERERFLVTPQGLLAPRAQDFLKAINDERWTYELSACQVEDRTRPQKDSEAIRLELLENDNNGWMVTRQLGLALLTKEVGPIDMPLDIYPDSRYLKIASGLPKEVLRAACQVTGTHLHLGMRNLNEAIETHNLLASYLEELSSLGDHSGGERLRIYRIMATNWQPPCYENAEEFFETARVQGFEDNPRNCWHLIRISRHGTVELRMFGVSRYVDEVISWVAYVRQLIGRRLD